MFFLRSHCCLVFLGILFGYSVIAYTQQPREVRAPRVVVPIEPIEYLVREIGGEDVEIFTLVSHQDDIHHYRILPSHLKTSLSCDFYFGFGGLFSFEKQLKKILLKQKRSFVWVNVIEQCTLIEHVHEKQNVTVDPHVWLSPQALMQMIHIITETFVHYDGQHASGYRLRSENLMQKIRQRQSDWQNRCQALEVKSFGVYHPAWGYFAREFGLNQIALEHHARGITYQHLKKSLQRCLDQGVLYLIIEPHLGRLRLRELSRTMGVEIKVLDPMLYTFLEEIEKLLQLLESR